MANDNYIVLVEDHLDELLLALYVFAFGSLMAVFGNFDFLPVLTDGPVFSLDGQFTAIGDPAADGTVITWAGALAILAGVTTYVTNLGVEALTEKPADFEVVDAALAVGVFGLPAVIAADLFSVHTDYIAGEPVASIGVFVVGVIGAIILKDTDQN
ncbi:hypothetical protein OB920_13120 [Halobacteria archaeon HArc-gm2]|nr:hypothetical protein [Halobacteria archaeon HArc-gm2]